MKSEEATEAITGMQEGVFINTLFHFIKNFCKIFVKMLDFAFDW